MELSLGNVNAWVDSFLEAAKQEEEEDGESVAEEETGEEQSCLVSTWRCLSASLEQAVRHSCRPKGLTR